MKYDEFKSSDAVATAKHYVLKDDYQRTKQATTAEAEVGSIIPEIISDSSEPLPPEQVADFSDLEDGKRSLDERCSEKEISPLDPPGSLIALSSEEFIDVPIPPAQIAIHEKVMEGKQKKKNTSTNISSKPQLDSQNAETSDTYNSSSTQSANSSNNIQRALTNNNNGDLQHAQQSNIQVIEATLVEEEHAPPVYNAVLVPEQVEQNVTGNDNGDPVPESDMQQDEFKEPNNNALSFWKRHKLAVSLFFWQSFYLVVWWQQLVHCWLQAMMMAVEIDMEARCERVLCQYRNYLLLQNPLTPKALPEEMNPK